MTDATVGPPTGTVTFLFTDVEGSTRLWEEASDEMARALERHDQILRSTISDHDGHVFSTAGDAFCAAFTRAADALATAVEAQRALRAEEWPAAAELRVRMGVHTGEAHERGGDYFGSALSRAARIMSAGHGGQILVSEVTVGLLNDVTLREVGTLQLRGLSRPETVSQVVAHGLETEFPALRSQLSVGNLAPDRDWFVGRERELAELLELTRNHRLVTLIGAGGVGKTRLATTCGQRWSDDFPDGVWLISLAEIGKDDEVALAVSSTVGFRPQPGSSTLDSAVEVLSDQRVLLILDNCEHVLDGVAELAEAILRQPGRAVMLATSREGLGIAGERLVAVRPLGTGDDSAEAVELFVERATAAGWTPADGDGDVLAELCRRLDGVPLAIELAASRARSIPLHEMLTRLDDRFRLLSGRRRVERHQTLHAAVGWSYDLLSDGERRLFDRLSVFAGPFMLEDAEAICADGDLDRLDIDDHLLALVEKSMVNADAGTYWLLETLNRFGAEQLAGYDDPERFRDAHLQHFAGVALEAQDGLVGPGEQTWIRRFDRSWGNLRAAVDRAIETENTEAAATILAHLGHFTSSSHAGIPEIRRWTQAALALPGIDTQPLYPALLQAAGWVAIAVDDIDLAEELCVRAEGSLIEGQPDFRPGVMSLKGSILGLRGRGEESLGAFRAGLESARTMQHPGEIAGLLGSLAFAFTNQGRYDEAVEVARSAVDAADQSGSQTLRGANRFFLGNALMELDPDKGEQALREAMAFFDRPRGYFYFSCLGKLARLRTVSGDHEAGLAFALEAVRITRTTGGWVYLWNQLMYTAMALQAVGEHETVALLLGGMSESWSFFGSVPRLRPYLDELRARASSELGEQRFDELHEQGTRLSAPGAAELAERAASKHIGVR